MPIYEYKCEDCGHEFEEMLHFSKRNIPLNIPCFDCEGKIHLKVSLTHFQLEGDGWTSKKFGINGKKIKEVRGLSTRELHEREAAKTPEQREKERKARDTEGLPKDCGPG